MLPPLLVRALFLPTLCYNLIAVRLFKGRRWSDRVDDHVILGALPLPWHPERMRRAGIRAVVNTCIEYGGPVAAYERRGIVQLYIPTLDFSPPKRADVDAAVEFIREFSRRGQDVYVHCKAGRGRSATVVLCWLIADKGMTPEQAFAHVAARRPHINQHLLGRQVIRDYHREQTSAGIECS